MPTESFELPEPVQPEGAAPEAPEVQPIEQALPEEPEQETVRFKYRDEEIDLPADAVRVLAERFGYEKPEAIINQLQVARDAQTLYRQARDYYERARGQSQAPPQPPVEERWSQHVQREQAHPRQDAEPDPISLLQNLDRRTQAFEQFIQEQRMQSAWQRQQQEEELVNSAMTEYEKFQKELKERGIPEYKIPDMNYLINEADRFGMLRSRVPIGDVYRNLHKMMFSEDYATAAVQKQMAKMREPTARRAVPSGPGATPPPRQSANPIDDMKIGDILPEGRY